MARRPTTMFTRLDLPTLLRPMKAASGSAAWPAREETREGGNGVRGAPRGGHGLARLVQGCGGRLLPR